MRPIWICGFLLLQRAHGCAQSGRGEELDLQKDTGFVRGISDGTTDEGLPPLEDLEDFEVRSKVIPSTAVRCGKNERSVIDTIYILCVYIYRLHYIKLCYIVLYFIPLYHIILNYIRLYHIILYHILLYHIISYYMILQYYNM